MNTIPCGACSFENRDVYFPPTMKPINYIANSPSHPSESKAILLRNLTEMRHELDQVDAEIELASAALSRMSITRHRILSSMQQHDKSLRPILSIPDDVLCLIFEWSVIFCPDMRGGDLLDSRVDSPWTLSHTCRHWRTVAISHSILWRDILMPPDKEGMLLLELSLQRSTNVRLDIDIQYHNTLNDADAARSFIDVIAPILKPTSQRWRSLVAHGPWIFTNMLFSGGGWSFKGMIHLDILFRRRYRPSDKPDVISSAFRDTPNLVRLSVEKLPNDAALDIRWGSLLFYECQQSTLSILGHLSAIETLIIDDGMSDKWSVTLGDLKKIAPIYLPSLHYLAVNSHSYPSMLSDLSDIMELPALRHLSIHLNYSGQIQRSPHFLEHVTHLNLGLFIENSEDYILDLLRCAGHVRVLYIRGYSSTEATVLRALQSRDIMPLLEWLHVDQSTMDNLAMEVFAVIEVRHLCRLWIINYEEEEWDYSGSRLSVDGLLMFKFMSLKERGMVETPDNYKF